MPTPDEILRRRQIRDNPGSPTNRWLSFSGGRNENEVENQHRIEELLKTPGRATMLQLENLYRQMALMNYLIQKKESDKIPSSYRAFSIQLSLYGAALNGQAMDQIMPGNPLRKRVTFLPTNAACLFAHKPMNSAPQITSLPPLTVLEFGFIPINTRWPIDSKEPIYAVGNDSVNPCYLTVVEEEYKQPLDKKKLHQIEEEEEKAVLHKNWLEQLEI